MNEPSTRVIITGATGMVGEGVLHICLADPAVEAVLVINRKPGGVAHPKLKEIIHPDFFDFSPIESQLSGYNACFFCLGVSSVGMADDEYYKLTYTLTMHVAQTLSRLNRDMTFCYVSSAGTDGTEKGRLSWARVKGKTENDLMKLPFRQAYAFRPGFIRPIKGLSHTHAYYNYLSWLFPLGRALYAKGFCRMEELANAMIHVVRNGYPKNVLEGDDIIKAGAAPQR
ncbi:NAD-dependent epimerase/dehydratase family protein [Tellurirhabdus bombi]|uniref:NAD-dependent epimerase/dehydratase family protein n=1 Tax=Tellurirhabdus bombi TaxID=2907205 RepID=UPI001F284E16|nr:NAD-dependent epimerase/dehydratase family protein [Tellurirhabdus bombi]